jgi:hypothetical protein
MKRERTASILLVASFCLFLVCIGGEVYAAGPDISGNWHGSNGLDYNIVQIGTTFNWKVLSTGEVGVGNINGNTCSAAWPFGFASGNVVCNPPGWPVEINWNNGVFFTRGGPPGGGMPGPGPGPGPTPGPGGDVGFSFGPNPARPGGEVWLDLDRNVGTQIKVFLNGMLLPIINTKGASYVTVKLPMNVKSGPIEIEYQVRRIQSNQPKKILDILPVDLSGNWRNKAKGYDYVLNQTNSNYAITWVNPGGILILIGADKGNGNTYDGNKLNVHWGAKPPSMTTNDVGTIVDIDPNGRAHRIQWNCGDVWERP